MVSTDPGLSRPGRAPSASACEPYREVIAEALARGRNAMAIWQDLVDDHGFAARYASVKRFVAKLRGEARPEARVVITTAPGEEAQVDYGEGPMVRDPDTGKYRRTRLFVLTLGYQPQVGAAAVVASSSAQIWAELHERAFRRLGGAPRVVVLDNLREGVIAPDVYDPRLNPLYRDVLKHYGVVALPCRVRDPDRKGKVEAASATRRRRRSRGCASRRSRRRRRTWTAGRSAGPTRASTARPSGRWRRCSPRRSRALQPLPVEPFRYYRYGERTVHLDGCVEVESAYYARAARLDRPRAARAVGRAARAAPRSEDRPAAARAPAARARPARAIQAAGPPVDARRRTHARAARPRRPRRPTHRRPVRSASTRATASPACAASSACSRSPRSTAPPPSTTPAPPPSSWACRPTAS